MPEVHFIGGPDDGKVVRTNSVGDVAIPDSYKLKTWMGNPANGMPWQRADLATFVHRDILAQGESAAFAASAEHWKRYVSKDHDIEI